MRFPPGPGKPVLVLALLFLGTGGGWLPRNVDARDIPPPRIDRLYPPGTRVGSSTRITLTGWNLGAIERFHVSGKEVEVVGVTPIDHRSLSLEVRARDEAEPGYRELRVEGARGISNPVLFRIDTLPQGLEDEPNDDIEHANPIAPRSVVAGVLQAGDLDLYRISARAGQRLTLEVEANRLAVPLSPVISVLLASGESLSEKGQSPGCSGDCRLTVSFPADGLYFLRVHDALYAGGEWAVYRLRVDDAPYATGLFPLGGPPGQPLVVSASGGILAEPRRRRLVLPDTPGAFLEIGPFEGPGGPVSPPPHRIVVGEGPEVFEPERPPGATSSTPLPFGATANGRIDRPGEVDRYIVPVRSGEAVRIKVQAASLGSWIDSVVRLLGPRGELLAENDDPPIPTGSQVHRGLVLASASDSSIAYESRDDGPVVIEIGDRFGRGGPEYGYRLGVGPPRSDFSVRILLPDSTARSDSMSAPLRTFESPSGTCSGALNFEPGTVFPVQFQVATEGRPGTIVVRASGLPPGVSAEPVRVRAGRGVEVRTRLERPPIRASLLLKIDEDAPPGAGMLRVEATGTFEEGRTLTRQALAIVVMRTLVGPGLSRTIYREQDQVPVRVVGRSPLKSPP